jgi:hypothetical protein
MQSQSKGLIWDVSFVGLMNSNAKTQEQKQHNNTYK